MKRAIFRIHFHSDDAKSIMAMCDRYGVEPRDFIRIGAMRYLENITNQREVPPGRGAYDLPVELKKRRSG